MTSYKAYLFGLIVFYDEELLQWVILFLSQRWWRHWPNQGFLSPNAPIRRTVK